MWPSMQSVCQIDTFEFVKIVKRRTKMIGSPFYYFDQLKSVNLAKRLHKVGCVLPMDVISIPPQAEFWPNDHRENAPNLWGHVKKYSMKVPIEFCQNSLYPVYHNLLSFQPQERHNFFLLHQQQLIPFRLLLVHIRLGTNVHRERKS